MSLKDMLVIADLDGTLLTSNKTIAQGDLDTISLFKMLGGNFTVGTGRTLSSVEMYPQLTPLLAPAITCGGCVIYDFQNGKPAQSSILPHLGARQALRDIKNAFPSLGIMVMSGDMRLYMLASSLELQTLISDEKMSYFIRPQEELPKEWNKVLFAAPQELLEEVQEFAKSRTYPGVYFVATNLTYLEMMPKGVSKGTAMSSLCEMLGIAQKNVHVIGDYYNDIDMMQKAGHAVAMRNAPKQIKDIADEVTADNDSCGVGQYLYKLINLYG